MKYTNSDTKELLEKYRLAGKIRFLSFLLLFLFLLLMKTFGGYSYLNNVFIGLMLIEAIVNQPYLFIIRRVNIYRFQYYQMATDIIAISWILYYMGGVEAPIVSIAYYAVILWAGVASTTRAVFFAVVASSFFFSSIVALEYFGFLPFISNYGYKMPLPQIISLLIGNTSFLFAFGYFSAYSSSVIRSLQRKRQEEALRNAHKIIATGYLVGRTAHDVLNNIVSAKGYSKLLLDPAIAETDKREMVNAIEKLHNRSADLVNRLGKFSQESPRAFEPTDIHKTLEDALDLTNPIVRYSKMVIEKFLAADVPLVVASGSELEEVFVTFILNSFDAVTKEGKFIIKTNYIKESGMVKIVFSDTGSGISRDNLKRLGEPFFSTKGAGGGIGLGLATAYEIIARHNGKIDVESIEGKGATFTIELPVVQPVQHSHLFRI
ncbi:MAG: ATP-binding protein [Candidatus Omnitrophica bacterium]|nr:ATP-binding protein [Candidatus Omnitrophota bacterium]